MFRNVSFVVRPNVIPFHLQNCICRNLIKISAQNNIYTAFLFKKHDNFMKIVASYQLFIASN